METAQKGSNIMTSDTMLSKLGQFKPGDKTDKHYDAWAKTYEQDLLDQVGYSAHILGARAFASICPDRSGAIVDIGCGTGLVGVELKQFGFSNIDGLDISPEMMAIAAEKSVYQRLITGDMNIGVSVPDGHYDAAICVGSFAPGHLAPSCLPEIIRLVKPGAPIVIFMNAAPYQAENYEDHIRALETKGLWSVTSIDTMNYMSALDRPGKLIIATKSP